MLTASGDQPYPYIFKDPTVDDKKSRITLRILSHGNSGILLTMGNAGFVSSTLLGRARDEPPQKKKGGVAPRQAHGTQETEAAKKERHGLLWSSSSGGLSCDRGLLGCGVGEEP